MVDASALKRRAVLEMDEEEVELLDDEEEEEEELPDSGNDLDVHRHTK